MNSICMSILDGKISIGEGRKSGGALAPPAPPSLAPMDISMSSR